MGLYFHMLPQRDESQAMKTFRKSPPADWLPRLARTHARSVNEHDGKALPASVITVQGRIVTVRLEVDCNPALPPLNVPIAENEYMRVPIQPGCKGLVVSADVSLGQMTGMGARRPALNDSSPNLSSCLFLPLSHAEWEKLDGNMLQLYGVAGVQVTDRLNGSSTVTLTKDSVTLSTGAATVTLSGGRVEINGELVINGQPYKAHQHSNGHNGAPTGGVI